MLNSRSAVLYKSFRKFLVMLELNGVVVTVLYEGFRTFVIILEKFVIEYRPVRGLPVLANNLLKTK